jgi:hypothetical protein
MIKYHIKLPSAAKQTGKWSKLSHHSSDRNLARAAFAWVFFHCDWKKPAPNVALACAVAVSTSPAKEQGSEVDDSTRSLRICAYRIRTLLSRTKQRMALAGLGIDRPHLSTAKLWTSTIFSITFLHIHGSPSQWMLVLHLMFHINNMILFLWMYGQTGP